MKFRRIPARTAPFESKSLSDALHEGWLDSVRLVEGGFEFRGWLRAREGNANTHLRFTVAGHEVANVKPCQFRWDLYQAGFSNPCAGFSVVVPEACLGGPSATVDLCSADSERPLASVVLEATSQDALNRGFSWSIESLAPVVRGWIKHESGQLPVTLALVINEELVTTFSPTIYRDDTDPVGSGPSGFEVVIPREVNDGRLLDVELHLLDGEDSRLIGRDLYSSGRARPKKVRGVDLATDSVRITGSQIAIVSTFSTNSQRLDATARTLTALTSAGLQVIVVDTSPEPASSFRLSELAPGTTVVCRENEGWDFGSWFQAIRSLGILDSPLDRLVLTNDSYFVTTGFEQSVRTMLQSSTDITGLTESLAHRRHLQSYLLSFKMSQTVAHFLDRLVETVGIQDSREGVIEAGELGMAEMANQDGLTSSALWTYEQLAGAFVRDFSRLVSEEQELGVERGPRDAVSSTHRCMAYLSRGVRLNPTHFFWRQLLEGGAGVIKRELIEKNPNQIDLSRLIGILAEDDRERLATDLAAHDLYLPELLCD